MSVPRGVSVCVLALLSVLSAGCASVVNGQHQSVSVRTSSKAEEVKGAKCSLSNDKGVWYLSTPGSASVHRSFRDLEVTCSSAGLPDGSVVVKSSTTAAAFGNILIGGVIGAGVDVATGAAYDYPNQIPVEMGQATRLESGSSDASRKTKVPFLNDAQQEQYAAFLGKPLPRAFAIAPNGHYVYAYSTSPSDKSLPIDPSERALLLCNRFAGIGCELYAVDKAIVFKGLPPQAQAASARSRSGPYAVDPVLAAAKPPLLNEGQQAEYQVFLTRSPPRAFAISDNGHFAMSWSTTPQDSTRARDPSARALASCRQMSGRECRLYLVDDALVPRPP